jgi:hypothetical protein
VNCSGLHLLRDRRQRRELIAGAWQIRDAVTSINRHGFTGLNMRPARGEYEVVRRASVSPHCDCCGVTNQMDRSRTPPRQLHLARHLDVILGVGGTERASTVIIGVGCTLTVSRRGSKSRVLEPDLHGRSGVVERIRCSRKLSVSCRPILGANRTVMTEPSGRCRHHSIRLVEHVRSVGRIVVSGQCHARLIRRRGAGNIVLVEPVRTRPPPCDCGSLRAASAVPMVADPRCTPSVT